MRNPLFALLLLFLPTPPSAQTPPRHHVGLFWRASSIKGTVYLLGSIRVGSAKLYPLPANIEAAFERSSALILELDTTLDDDRVEPFMDRNGTYPEGDDVYKHLGPAYSEKLKKFAAKYDIPEDNLGTLKPWVVIMATGMWPTISDKSPSLGIDEHFISKAKGKKPILAIETAEGQLSRLASIPESTQVAILDDSLDNPPAPDLADKLALAWMTGNSEYVERAELGFLPRYPAVRRSILDDRNARMAAFAAARLKAGGTYFMVVGAAHILGKQGIAAILRREGFSVTAQ